MPCEESDISGLRDKAKSQGHHDEDINGEHNEWKFRAPYRIHSNDSSSDNSEPFNALYEGSCHCGRVQYQLSRERPLASKICHCTTCQVLHGAMFQWAAIFEKTDINFSRGHHDLVWYDSADKTTVHKLPCKVSCSYCRSPIMDEGKNMILLFPGLIKFKTEEERERFEPQCHLFYNQRLIDINDGKPKWSGLNDKSDLLNEDEMNNKRRKVAED